MELLDGTLKLLHCTEVFTMRFPPWSLPRAGNGVGKRHVITPGHLLDAGGNVGKRVRLTRKTRPGASSDKFTAFLGTLYWPVGSEDMGHLGVLILFEQWAGHRLLTEKVTRPRTWANRPILIPSVPLSEGIEIRHGCQFISSLVRALAKLLGGIGRFLPGGIGSHMSHWNPLIINALRLNALFWSIPRFQQRSF